MIYRLLILFALDVGVTILAAVIVERSVRLAFEALKLALKFEFTTSTGVLNLVSMILIVLLIVFFNLHEMIASALSIDPASRTQDRVIAPVALVSLFFIGSIICAMLVERKK